VHRVARQVAFQRIDDMETDLLAEGAILLLSALVDVAPRANLSDDDVKILHSEKDSKIADPRRSLIVPALHGLRVSQVERIGLQFFELLLQAATGRHIAPTEVLGGCTG